MLCSLLRHKTKYFLQFYHQFKTVQSKKTIKPANIRIMATKVSADYANFDAKISLENPLADYEKLVEEKMMAEVVMTNEIYKQCWSKISAAARETIWKLLFDNDKPTKEQLAKISEFLKKHKEDACFHQAGEYNRWIVKVRDELLKRNMLEFWKNEMVAKELGPCWARDSDLFDDPDDPEPAKFYKYAGCEAAWLKKKTENAASQNDADLVASSLLTAEQPESDKKLKKLSTETPLEDYKYNVEAQGEIDGDDEDAYNSIFAEARKMIWQLLFSEATLSSENSKKAADLLDEYKRDACFYNPWDYNDWVPKLRSELLKRKYFDFWQDVIVKKELGLCWARDSDFFDDMEDTKPQEFYKVGEDYIKKHKK
ncbi:endonuclease G inhibitor [Cochliomyia hominivorax]